MLKPHIKNLRHQIELHENISQSEIEQGVWRKKLLVYAEIQAVSDNIIPMLENLNFNHIITEALFLFKLRFTESINVKMRIVFNKRTFEIKRIINFQEKNRWLQIIALEII